MQEGMCHVIYHNITLFKSDKFNNDSNNSRS